MGNNNWSIKEYTLFQLCYLADIRVPLVEIFDTGLKAEKRGIHAARSKSNSIACLGNFFPHPQSPNTVVHRLEHLEYLSLAKKLDRLAGEEINYTVTLMNKDLLMDTIRGYVVVSSRP